jgi:hypothetical protein
MKRGEIYEALAMAMDRLDRAMVDLKPLRQHEDPALAATAGLTHDLLGSIWSRLYDQRKRFDVLPTPEAQP